MIKLNKCNEDCFEFTVSADISKEIGERLNSTSYDTKLVIVKDEFDGWQAHIKLGDDMPFQDSPDEAIERLRAYLKSFSKIINKRNFKHINMENMFQPKN